MAFSADIVIQDTSFSADLIIQETKFETDLTITSGPPGKDGADGSEAIVVTGLNVSGTPIVSGQAVATAPAGVGFVLADFADLDRRGVGVVRTGAAAGEELEVVLLGVCEVADWIVSTGGNWLPPNGRFFLASDGLLTTTPSAENAGEYDQVIGSVISPQKLIVLPGPITELS